MKKLSLPLTILVLVVLGGLIWTQRGGSSHTLQPAALLPARTILLAELPDVVASRERWKTTALAAIFAEPEVRAFLERPLSPLAKKAHSSDTLALFLAVKPRQAFTAVVDFEGKMPTIAAGFRFAGSRGDLEELLTPLKDALLKKFPSAIRDIEQIDGEVVETITTTEFTYAAVVVGDIYLMATDAEVLKSMLAGVKGHGPDRETTLAASAAYVDAMAQLPTAYEGTLFIEPSSLVTRITTLAAASGSSLNAEHTEKLKSVRAVAVSTTFEEHDIRDTIFVLQDTGGEVAPLSDAVMRYTSPATMAFYAGLLNLPSTVKLPDTSVDKTGMLTVLKVILEQMEGRGFGMDQLRSAFGPGVNFQLEWPEAAPQPVALIAVDVKDHKIAARFVHDLVTGELGFPPMAELDSDGTTVYSLSSMGRIPVSPSLALTESDLLIGLDPGQVAAAAQQQQEPKNTLAGSKAFAASRAQVCEPTQSLVYVDARALFDRVYGTFRPFIIMGAAFMPSGESPVDFTKLPNTEVVSQHLGAIVFSQSVRNDGILSESVGPVTLNQLMLIGGAGIGSAVVKKHLEIE